MMITLMIRGVNLYLNMDENPSIVGSVNPCTVTSGMSYAGGTLAAFDVHTTWSQGSQGRHKLAFYSFIQYLYSFKIIDRYVQNLSNRQ